MKKLFAFSLVMMVTSLQAFAGAEHMETFKAKYPDSSLTKCTVCHEKKPALNAYGHDFASKGYDYVALETLDSDGDGVKNIDEINKGTFPGNKASF